MSATEPTVVAHQFSADRPITSKEEDLLGRTEFASALAESILGWRGDDSLVVGLYGAWGSGKSSVKNLVLESLRERKNTPLEILEFNPWQWAGHGQLAAAFYHQVGIAIGRADPSGDGKKRVAKWKAYSAYSTVAASAATSFSGVATLLGRPELGFFGALFAGGFGKIAKVSQKCADALAARAGAVHRELSELKQELSDELRRSKKPVLVVMDDIDRLTAEEIRLLFQLVKGNADFPNLIYLLLFQRESVAKSLESVAPGAGVGSGEEFLAKIVQVAFDLPQAGQSRIEKVLISKLNSLLSESTISKRFNAREQHRWWELYYGGLRPYFGTLRDVHRLVSTLSLQIGMFRKGDSFEASPVDVVALGVLRHFEPDVYASLPAFRETLTKQADPNQLIDGDWNKKRTAAEPILARAKHRERVNKILKELFPPAAILFDGIAVNVWAPNEWLQDLRVCHREVFDRYFQLAIPEGDVAQADIDYIIASADKRDVVFGKLSALSGQQMLVPALKRLEAHKERIPSASARPFITALFDIGDELHRDSQGMFEAAVEWIASFIVESCLRKEPKSEVRAGILRDALRDTTGLYLPVLEIGYQSDREERGKPPEARLLEDKDLSELQKLCVERIEEAAKSGRLRESPHLETILYWWKEWDGPDEPRKWTADLIKSDEGILRFVSAFVRQQRSHTFGEYSSQTQPYIDMQKLQQLVPLDVVGKRLAQLPKSTLTSENQQVIELFGILQKQWDRPRTG